MCLKTDSEVTRPRGSVWFGRAVGSDDAGVKPFLEDCVVDVGHLVAETGGEMKGFKYLHAVHPCKGHRGAGAHRSCLLLSFCLIVK